MAKRRFRNSRRENELEELGRVDAEKAHTPKGKRNLMQEKRRIIKEVSERHKGYATGGRAKPMPSDGDRLWRQTPQPQRGRGSRRKKFKTHGGGPDAGNIGKLKDALSKAKKVIGKKARPSPEDLKRIGEKMPKKYPPKREAQPLRKGGRARGPNRPRPQGPHMWVRGDKRKKYASGGVVMSGKKVGCQIK